MLIVYIYINIKYLGQLAANAVCGKYKDNKMQMVLDTTYGFSFGSAIIIASS